MKYLRLLVILPFLVLFVVSSAFSAPQKPLAGKWKLKNDGEILHLKNDGTFTWNEDSGKWFLEDNTLYIHTPGKLNGYKFQLKGNTLYLSGGSFVAGTREFEYISKGDPVAPQQAAAPSQTPLLQSIKPDSTSLTLSDIARDRIYLNPLCGAWRAIEPIGNEDTLIFNASGRYNWDRDNKGLYRFQGDRVYLSHETENEEYFFLIENPFLVIGFHKDYLPRLYIKTDLPVQKKPVRDFEDFNGTFVTEDSVRTQNRALLHLMEGGTEILSVDSYGRMEGTIIDSENDTTYTWGGYAHPYGSSLELRFDNGDLKTFDVSYEYDPLIGKIIQFNGNLYTEKLDDVYKIDSAERMEPYDASSLRHIISEIMRDANIKYRQLPFED